MSKDVKNNVLFVLVALLIGLVAGFVVWGFMCLMHLGINFLWEYVPAKIEIPFYTFFVCTIGGLLIGLWHKKTGKYPEDMEDIMDEIKEKKRYNYDKLFIIFLSALFPIVLGASIGPEAGLVGIIAGICTWIGDKFKVLSKEKNDLSSMGLSAALGAIFGAPLFGLAVPMEGNGETLPKKIKIISYLLAAIGAWLAFKLLSLIYSGGSGLPNFYGVNMASNEYIGLLFLIFIGVVCGYIFTYSSTLTKKLSNLISSDILKGLLAGIILGVCGTLFPYTMFSGEEQTIILKEGFKTFGAVTLIATGILKLLLTNICLAGGLRGGHFFPVIFSGVSLGYGTSLLTGLDPIFCVIIITTSLLSFTMRKPLATILLLMMFFPPICIVPMIIAATLPVLFPIPNAYNK